MKRFHRSDRVGEELVREISHIIQREMKDPRLGFVSVTRAEVAKDLRHANIFVSVLGSDDEKTKTMKALQSGAGFIRTLISKRLTMRVTPEFTFRLDDSMERGARIQELLRKAMPSGGTGGVEGGEGGNEGEGAE
ncbi:MAG: 30S ribosome-binding factor RbfA [Nitrospinae bacterium]|nr:30S ribosome-binding factor RbfA [Nitrospinota bacterium]